MAEVYGVREGIGSATSVGLHQAVGRQALPHVAILRFKDELLASFNASLDAEDDYEAA